LGVRSREETEGVIVKRALRCPIPIAASLTALVLVVAVSGCGGGSGGGTAPPSNLTYSTNPATYTKGVPIAANTPSSSGGAVASYSVSPALPAGLAVNTSTGVITGTPTAVTATASYTVTASNSGGRTTASVSVTVNDAPPSNLTYSTNPATYTKGAPIAANTPSSSGGAVASYSVSPALPAGLRLDGSTGVITGTPTAVTATASYTVTASNSGGSTTASVRITIVDAPSGGSAALVGGASHLTSGTLTMEAIVGPPFNPSGASGTKTLRPAENTR
jgi:uncharacterized repeat protein (TIGR01451 family)